MQRAFYFLLAIFLSLHLLPTRVRAETMTSPCYVLQMGNLNMNAGTKTSGSYQIVDTGGQTAPGLYDGSQDAKAGFANIFPTPSAPATFVPCPSPLPTPTPEPTPSPGPTVPPIIDIVTQILVGTGILTPLITTELGRLLTELAPAAVAALPVAIATLAIAQTVTSFIPIIVELISRILQSIGLIPIKRPRGVVFDTKTGKGIPFATISFVRVKDNQIFDTVVSDTSGVYRSVKLPPDIYRIEAVHGDYIFPTKLTPKFALNPHDFYRGEPFEIQSSNQEELFLIPMDPLFEEVNQRRPLSFYLQVFTQIIRRLVHDLFYPMVIFSVIVTLIFPTIFNIAIVILYAIMIVYRVRHTRKQPPLIGQVVDRYGKPLSNVLIRIVETQTNHVSALVITDDEGRFRINLAPLQYTLILNRDGYVIEQPSQDYSNFYVAHTGREGEVIIHMMTVKEAFPDSVS